MDVEVADVPAGARLPPEVFVRLNPQDPRAQWIGGVQVRQDCCGFWGGSYAGLSKFCCVVLISSINFEILLLTSNQFIKNRKKKFQHISPGMPFYCANIPK